MMDFGYRALILGDPKDEYKLLCRALGVEPFRIGPGLPTRINPLAFGPLGDGWDRLDAEEALNRAAIVFGRWLTLVCGLLGSQRIGEHRVPLGPSDEVVVKAALQHLTGYRHGDCGAHIPGAATGDRRPPFQQRCALTSPFGRRFRPI
jgi:hypothetical protein